MELTVLGSGSLVPTLHRGTAGFVLKVSGRTILIDSGSGTLYRLLQAGLTYNDIDIICYTHVHLDHVGDFPTFLFACKYGMEPRERDLLVIGGKGFVSFYDRLKAVYGDQILSERFDVIVEEEMARDFGEFAIRTGPVDHIPQSVAFRIESTDGRSVVFSGDTDYSTNLINLAKDADVLVTECSFPDDRKVEGHLTPSFAGKIAQEANAKRLVLAHLYPPCDEVDIAGQCRKTYNGEVIVAEDQMRIKI
jgi:ribonuclease BN (tRNA processing enzyme)